ncbi:MAG TPA: DUF6781 family protein [Burkholderiales bacterium]|jgi:hypothetical protein
MSQQDMSNEQIREAASASMAAGDNIRERVRELTLQALQSRRLDFSAMREVMTSLTQGISLGAERRGHDVRQALSEAFAGMDQAMSKAAQASSLALKELAARGRDFSDNELKQGLERMRQMEGDFLDSVRQVSQSASGSVKSEWQELIAHAQRAGTDTGRVISQTARDFSARMTTTVSEGAIAGVEAARQFGERFAAATSGMLAGMSEALRPDKDKEKSKEKNKKA